MTLCKRFASIAMALALSFSSAGCGAAADPYLFIYSTIDALLAGAYDGEMKVTDLQRYGNFGLGTFNGLDGELVAVDGVFYHVHASGVVSVAAPYEQVPLAYVLPFVASVPVVVEPMGSLGDLEAWLDRRFDNKNLFHAIQVRGRFANVTTRAIAPQVRPYKPLAEVAKTQVLFEREAVSGTLVGIRSPAFSKGVSVPGYHWHFISEDHKYGGHVLKLSLSTGAVSTSTVSRFVVRLPMTDDFANADQAKDRAAELHRVESQR
jgi:acetolactate decarboxylase